jgi:membrane-associated phospholipid phosphatase
MTNRIPDRRTAESRPEPQPSPARAFAAAVSEVCAPAVLVSLFLILAASRSAEWPEGIVYSLVSVGFTTALPLAGVLLLVRRGHVSDHHISDRRQRAPILAGSLVSIAAGLALLVLLDAPGIVIAAVLCTVGGVVAVLVANLWWKLSAHSAVAVFVVFGAVPLLGPWGFVLIVVPAAVGWSRVALHAHTAAQVIAGYAVGAVIGAAFVLSVARP